MTAKEFALSQLAPYYHNPELCGYEGEECCYLTEDGQMCVLGKNLVNPEDFFPKDGAKNMLLAHGEDILKEESRGILTPTQWQCMQFIQDAIADPMYHPTLENEVNKLNLFTLEELKSYGLPEDIV